MHAHDASAAMRPQLRMNRPALPVGYRDPPEPPHASSATHAASAIAGATA
jgi:hypothetical protein